MAPETPPKPGPRSQALFGILVAVAILMGSSAFALHVVMWQFGGYDLSHLIDLSWRFQQGQVPGQDFINTLPALYLFAAKTVPVSTSGWIGFTWVNVSAALVTFAFFPAYGRSFFRSPTFPATTAIAISIPLVYTNHLWHSSLSQYAAAIFTFAVYQSLHSEPGQELRRTVLLFLASALVILAKQNISVPILLIALGSIFVFGERRLLAIGTVAAGAMAGFLSSISLLHLSLSAWRYSYLAVSGRARISQEMVMDLFQLRSTLGSLLILLCGLLVVEVALKRGLRTRKLGFLRLALMASLLPLITDWDSKLNNLTWPLIILAIMLNFGSWSVPKAQLQSTGTSKKVMGLRLYLVVVSGGFLLAAVLPLITSGDSKMNNLTWPLIILAIMLNFSSWSIPIAQRQSTGTPRKVLFLRLYLVVVSAGFLLACWGGWTRERMRSVGLYFQKPAATRIQTGLFRGLWTGSTLGGILRELTAAKTLNPRARFFFGPRMEFAYASTGSPSPKGLPLWWHPGTSYALPDEGKIIQTFQENRFDRLAFAGDDRTRLPTALINWIKENYTQVPGYSFIELYAYTGPRRVGSVELGQPLGSEDAVSPFRNDQGRRVPLSPPRLL